MNHIPTAYRVLLLLKLFLKHRTITFECFQKEIDPLLKQTVADSDNLAKPIDPLSLSAFRKYVKTLRFLGCAIKTINQGKTTHSSPKNQAYQLEQHPFPWVPTQPDWLFFLQLYSHCSKEEQQLLSPLVWSLSPSLSRQFASTILTNKQKPFERQLPTFLRNGFNKELQQCIKNIEEIQQAGDGILLWLKQEQQELPLLPEPRAITENAAALFYNMPFLCGIPQQLELKEQGVILVRIEDVKSYQQYLVPLSLIEGIRPIPMERLLMLRPQLAENVQFRISGKLVDSYEKRANETIVETHYFEETGLLRSIVIEAFQVDVLQLFQRLKRYGQYAELLTPFTLRNEFTHQLKKQQTLL